MLENKKIITLELQTLKHIQMKKITSILVGSMLCLAACNNKSETKTTMNNISQTTVENTVKQLSEKYPEQSSRIERSVPQVAAL
jgi:uncharacterized lipoprotein YehR (DUF1307 family)